MVESSDVATLTKRPQTPSVSQRPVWGRAGAQEGHCTLLAKSPGWGGTFWEPVGTGLLALSACPL